MLPFVTCFKTDKWKRNKTKGLKVSFSFLIIYETNFIGMFTSDGTGF